MKALIILLYLGLLKVGEEQWGQSWSSAPGSTGCPWAELASLDSEELFWDLHLHFTNLQQAEGKHHNFLAWTLQGYLSPQNNWVFDLPITQIFNKTLELPLGDGSTSRHVIKKSIVLSAWVHWQLTINQFTTSEVWTLFKMSLGHFTTVFIKSSSLVVKEGMEFV